MKYAASYSGKYDATVVIPGVPEEAIVVVLASMKTCFISLVPNPTIDSVVNPTCKVFAVTVPASPSGEPKATTPCPGNGYER